MNREFRVWRDGFLAEERVVAPYHSNPSGAAQAYLEMMRFPHDRLSLVVQAPDGTRTRYEAVREMVPRWYLRSDDEIIREAAAYTREVPRDPEEQAAVRAAIMATAPDRARLMVCGHPESEVVSGDEGTAYCGACEREAPCRCPCHSVVADMEPCVCDCAERLERIDTDLPRRWPSRDMEIPTKRQP